MKNLNELGLVEMRQAEMHKVEGGVFALMAIGFAAGLLFSYFMFKNEGSASGN
ncbi:hypothetical protein [Reichenbachiella agariperforans]|nr:hypothetical protein [Reichenbachiella agariperforans]MBU2914983.1 hypothetical protein [Reichenbachiella agariperforans]